MQRSRNGRLWVTVWSLVLIWTAGGTMAADWPMWRYDARRGAASPAELPAELRLQWVRELPAPRPAWPQEQDYHGKLEFDVSYEPVVAGKTLFLPSMTADSLTAYDTDSGEERWRFYADGPIRFAPAVWDGRVYFVSDDGCLYCLNAADGRLLWKFRGGPAVGRIANPSDEAADGRISNPSYGGGGRKLLGNERLISAWPARGGPVVADGTVYFAAGIWPFMGTFIHALDAETGQAVWTNSGTGAIYNLHQHGGANAFGGVAPQGYLAVGRISNPSSENVGRTSQSVSPMPDGPGGPSYEDDRLVVAGGLTVPAVFDRATGEFLHFRQSNNDVGKGAGGYAVAVQDDWYFNNTKMYRLDDGTQLMSQDALVLNGEAIIALDKGTLVAHASPLDVKEVEVTDRRGEKKIEKRYSLRELWKAKVEPALDHLHIQAGSRLYGSGKDGLIAAVDLPRRSGTAKVAWTGEVKGDVWRMLAADDKLFVVTRDGGLYCFGEGKADANTHALPTPQPAAAGNRHAATVERILNATDLTGGYALVWGLQDGRLVEELVRQSDLHVIAVDPDADKIAALRRRFDEAGLYGRRVALLAADPLSVEFPPYLASLIVSESLPGRGDLSPHDIKRLFHPLRPYGGTAWLPIPEEKQAAFDKQVEAAKLEKAQTGRQGEFASLTRAGALPGAGSWTHQYGSSANTVFSREARAKAPLGVLWFGGPSNRHALPRHAQGPIPHVIGGRLIIEGVHTISARCVYTGRELWVREFPDIGFPYQARNHTFTGTVYIQNQPGANYVGSNYASAEDSVYVVYENECQRLDSATGETLATFRLPPEQGEEKLAGWGYVAVSGDLLIAGAGPQMFDDGRIGEKNWNATSSRRVVVMDRRSGEVLWTHEAVYGFRHNAIVPAGGRLFLIDGLSEGALALLKRRGIERNDTPRLTAFDLQSGEPLWSHDEDVFGTWLGYSEEHDVLVQAGRTGGRESLPDEPSNRIIAHRGETGAVLWDKNIKYTGPLVLHGEEIVSSERGQGSLNLLTGEERTRRHPLTGETVPWSHTRMYGCGTMLAGEHLLTFRSGAAGFFDYSGDGGTGNFGGFRAGCTPNLIPADGVLNAPDYTRTCSCSYQNQTSLALIHMPDVETWTYNTLQAPEKGELVRRVGINFGAPGDRLADDGTLWLDYPSVGGPSPDIPVRIGPEKAGTFRRHASQIENPTEGLSWVASSGIQGVESVTLTLATGDAADQERTCTVRLHFAEPDPLRPGERVFHVALQERPVLKDFDIARETGGPNRAVVREFKNVRVTNGTLQINLTPAQTTRHPPVLSGVEVRLDD